MTQAKALAPDFHGSPGPSTRVVRRAAGDAEKAAGTSEPEAPPEHLPAYRYGPLERKRRAELLDERTLELEEQRFKAEMDWDTYVAQLEALEMVGSATDEEIKPVRTAERQVRLRVISLNAALTRLNKRRE